MSGRVRCGLRFGRAAAVLLAALSMGAAGCAVTDPLDREGLWRPIGANEFNLRLMVAVPSDLVQGVSASSADGHGAARAVQRLRQDRVKPLPNVGISRIAPVTAAPEAAAPAEAGAAGGG